VDKTFGSSLEFSYPSSVQQTSDGGYIIVGTTGVWGTGAHEIGLIKTDTGGNKIWDKTFGNTGADTASSVQQTSDGGYIIKGLSGGANLWLIKTDPNGNTIWDKLFYSLDESFTNVQPDFRRRLYIF